MNVWIAIYITVEWIVRIGMAFIIVLRQQRPNSALAWLVLVMLLPVPGLVLYLLFGEAGFRRARVMRYCAGLGLSRQNRARTLAPELREKQRILEGVTERLGAPPARGGNDVEFLTELDQFLARLCADIAAAKHHVHLLYFIIADDDAGRRIVDALVAARGRGVEVRVLADAAGSFGFFMGLDTKLRDAGAEVHDHLPVNPLRRKLIRFDLRNHRKLAIIDGRVAFTGSNNLVQDDVGISRRARKRGARWQDVTVRLEGPSVTGLQEVFADDWHFETDQVLDGPLYFPTQEHVGDIPVQIVPSGPHQPEALVRDCLVEALHTAKRHVIISTPYFVPDESLMAAMRLAALRGAQVDLVVPRQSDKVICDLVARSHFEELMNAGVRIHLHQKGILHAKTLTVDDEFSLVTSANFDIRSFFLNFELGVLLYERNATARLRFCQTRYIEESQKVNPTLWAGRSLRHRLPERFARLLSPLL